MTIFSQIISGQLPCYKLYEDDLTLAFLDIFPIQAGHVLIIPKVEFDYWLEVPVEYYNAVHSTARLLAPAIQNVTGGQRIGQMVDGRDVAHFHLHLIPMIPGQGLLAKTEQKPTPEDFVEMQNKIITNLQMLSRQ